MLSCRPRPTPKRPPTLSTTPPTPETERTNRHMRLCERMADLAMSLAETAAARAQNDLAPTPEPKPSAVETAKPAPRRGPDAATLFTRLCRIIQTAITLECRFAAGLIPPAPKLRPVSAALPIAPAKTTSPTAAALAASTSFSPPLAATWPAKPGPAPPAKPSLDGRAAGNAI